MNQQTIQKRPGSTLVEEIIFKYFPFWPLFLLLAILFLLASRFYLKNTQPVYEATATILLTDQMKGSDQNQVPEALNLPTNKNIVENELEVLHSRRLMEEVVADLKLYAPIYKKGGIKDSVPSYAECPVSIEVSDPGSIKLSRKIPFTVNMQSNSVTFLNNNYPLNQFINSPYGNLRFVPKNNPTGIQKADYLFTLLPLKVVINGNLKALEATASGKTATVVKIKMQDQEPKRAEDILNQLLQKYTQSSIDYKNQLAKNTMAFIDARLNILSNNIKEVEKQVENYKSSNGITNLDDQSKLYMQTVTANDQRLSDINIQLAALDQVQRYVNTKDNSQMISPSSLGVNDPTLTKLVDRLAEEQMQYEKLKRTTGANNPMVQTVQKQIEDIRPSIVENIQNQRSALLLGKNNISRTISGYNSVLQNIPRKEKGLIDVTRDQTVKNNTYSFLLEKREQAALAYSSTVPDSRVVDAAESSSVPVSPKKPIIYLIALGAALVVTLAYILIRELFTDKVLFRKEIETATDHPVAGEIPFQRGLNGNLMEPTANIDLERQLNKILTATGILSSQKVNHSILITSSLNREGKTFITINLARFLARTGKKVLIIDGDPINCSVTSFFKLKGQEGLSQLMMNDKPLTADALIKPSGYERLFVLPCGFSNNTHATTVINAGFHKILNSLKENYDHIIIDSTSLEMDGSADLLSKQADQIFFIIRHGVSSKTAVKQLDYNPLIHSLGNFYIIFNGVKKRGFLRNDYGFGYGYENLRAVKN